MSVCLLACLLAFGSIDRPDTCASTFLFFPSISPGACGASLTKKPCGRRLEVGRHAEKGLKGKGVGGDDNRDPRWEDQRQIVDQSLQHTKRRGQKPTTTTTTTSEDPSTQQPLDRLMTTQKGLPTYRKLLEPIDTAERQKALLRRRRHGLASDVGHLDKGHSASEVCKRGRNGERNERHQQMLMGTKPKNPTAPPISVMTILSIELSATVLHLHRVYHRQIDQRAGLGLTPIAHSSSLPSPLTRLQSRSSRARCRQNRARCFAGMSVRSCRTRAGWPLQSIREIRRSHSCRARTRRARRPGGGREPEAPRTRPWSRKTQRERGRKGKGSTTCVHIERS